MAVDYSEFTAVVVIDANIALEGMPLPDLPWAEIDPVGPILVVLLPTTLREIDTKKSHGRLAPRAREFGRLVRPLVKSDGAVEIVAGPPVVMLTAAKGGRINWSDYPDLNSDQADDRLVAEVLRS